MTLEIWALRDALRRMVEAGLVEGDANTVSTAGPRWDGTHAHGTVLFLASDCHVDPYAGGPSYEETLTVTFRGGPTLRWALCDIAWVGPEFRSLTRARDPRHAPFEALGAGLLAFDAGSLE